MERRQGLVSAVTLAIAVAFTGMWVWQRQEAPQEPPLVAPEHKAVDPSVPEYKLLESVLYVDEWRAFGNPVGFTHVPKSRPPGLVSVGPGNPPNLSGGSHRGTGNGALIDVYVAGVGGSRVFGFIEFSARPTSTCDDVEEMTHAVCVRSGKLPGPSPTDPDIRYVTVYFTADNGAALTGAEATKAKKFWKEVDIVPVSEAAWFTDVVTRARAAAVE